MANDHRNVAVAVGGADVQIAAWAPNAAATGHTSLGILKTAPELTPEDDSFIPDFENLVGNPLVVPIKAGDVLKLTLAEATHANLAIARRQNASNITGTGANTTITMGVPEEQYKSIKIIGKGIAGTNGTRGTETVTLHRCAIIKAGPVVRGKNQEQLYELELKVCQDTTVTTNDVFWKSVIASAA